MFACVCPCVTVNKKQCLSREPHGAEACQHSQPQLPVAAPMLSHDPALGRELAKILRFPLLPPFRAKFSVLASRPINLSTPALQQEMGCSDVKATFIIIPVSYSNRVHSH